MKVSKLENINLSDYKLAYYSGESLSSSSMCQDSVMQLVEWWGTYKEKLYIALIPKNARLTECSWDDWDDNPAEHNASGLYRYPVWTIFLQWNLWTELTLVEEFWH